MSAFVGARAAAIIDHLEMERRMPVLLDSVDLEEARAFVALAIDPAIPFTRAVNLIAERIGEIRHRVSIPPLAIPRQASDLPGAGPPTPHTTSGRTD